MLFAWRASAYGRCERLATSSSPLPFDGSRNMKVSKHEPGTPCWGDLMSRDVKKARSFYGEVFGWKYEVGPEETGYYSICQTPTGDAAGMGQMSPVMEFPPAWTVYFAVDSADDTVAQVKKNGGQVVMEPMDVMDQGRMAIVRDPEGAGFNIIKPAQAS